MQRALLVGALFLLPGASWAGADPAGFHVRSERGRVVEGSGDPVTGAVAHHIDGDDDEASPAQALDRAGAVSTAMANASVTTIDTRAVASLSTALATISGNDPQIAVSKQFVLVAANGTLALYDKAGHRVNDKRGTKPYVRSPMDIFQPVWNPHDPHNINSFLNLPRGFACNPTADPGSDPTHASTKYCLDDYYDTRVSYDFYRDRFWIVALARNSCARYSGCLNGGDKITDPHTLQARRSYLLIAESKTNDPRDGFVEAWYGGALDEGACNAPKDDPCPGSEYRPGDAADYPTMVVTEKYLMVTTDISNVIADARGDSKLRYSAVHLLMADRFTRERVARLWVLHDVADDDGNVITQGLTPALPLSFDPVTYLALTQTDKIVVVAFASRDDGKPTVVVRGVAALNHPLAAVEDSPLPGTSATMQLTNLGNLLTGLVKLHGFLYAAMQDCPAVSAGTCHDGARVVQIAAGVVHDHGALDVVFDQTLVGTDAGGAVTHLGVPGLMVNDRGDLAVDYVRSGKHVFPEARFTYFFAGGAHPRVDGLLKPGNFAATGNLDTAGAALDPSDGIRIWVAHGFGDAAAKTHTIATAALRPQG